MTCPFDAPLGNPPTLEWIPLSQLSVDSQYQRSIDARPSQKLIRDIAKGWDWRLFQPLSVSRRGDGSLWVVDGQHRLAAARLRGDMPHLPCVISSQDSRLGEARAFVGLNKKRRALNSVDVFKALLVTGHAESVEVMKLIETAGLRIAPHSNYMNWKPGDIYCIPGIAGAYRRFGPEVTGKALNAIATAFKGQVLQHAGMLVRGIVIAFAKGGFNEEAFVERLGKNSQTQWMHKARKRQADHEENITLAIANAMIEAVTRA